MPILKRTKTPGGVPVTYHKVIRLESDFRFDKTVALVHSFSDEAAANAGLPLVWGWEIPIDVGVLSGGDLRGSIEASLVCEGMPFEGGGVVIDQLDTLSGARVRAWAAVKAARAVAEEGNFTYDGGSYKADKARINSSTTAAVLCKTLGLPYSETWTLADNTTRALDGDKVIALGLALNQHVSSVFATARELREQINQAGTIEAVKAIKWPA